MLLVVLALLGFSALCLADPVLMAQRYNSDRSHIRASFPRQAVRLTSIDQKYAWNAFIGLGKREAPAPGPGSLCLAGQSWNWRAEALLELASPWGFSADIPKN